MLTKLAKIAAKYEELQKQLYDPAISSDHQKMTKLNRELSALQETYDLYKYLQKRENQRNEAKELLEMGDEDPEMKELAKEQLVEAEEHLQGMEEKIKIALLPKDPNDEKNIFLEIRPAAGGDESGLFAAELLRMYLRYAEDQ